MMGVLFDSGDEGAKLPYPGHFVQGTLGEGLGLLLTSADRNETDGWVGRVLDNVLDMEVGIEGGAVRDHSTVNECIRYALNLHRVEVDWCS